MDRVIGLENLKIGYDPDNAIIKQLHLDIVKGSFVTIIGPNGCGKSTLIKSISKLLPYESGEIEVLGNNINNLSHRQLSQHMAVVHQENSIDFEFSVLDIVLMGRSPFLTRFQKETKEDMDITISAMEKTNVLHLKDRSINELSGGERQRVIIARAIAQNPKLILLDEPTSHLDIHHQIEVLELLKKLNQQNDITVVVVLHDLNMAARYSSRIVLMKDGKVEGYGSPEEVINHEILRKVYGMEMVIEKRPQEGFLNIIPLYTIK